MDVATTCLRHVIYTCIRHVESTSHTAVPFRGEDVSSGCGYHVSETRHDNVLPPRRHHETALPYVTGPPRGSVTWSPHNGHVFLEPAMVHSPEASKDNSKW